MQAEKNQSDSTQLPIETLSKVAKNAGSGAGGKLLFYLFNYLAILLITRAIGASNYGLVVLAYSMVVVVAMAGSLGLNEGIVRYGSFYYGKRELKKVKGTLISSLRVTTLSSLILTVSLFFTAKFWAVKLFSKPELTPLLKIFALAIIPLVLERVLTAGLQAIQLIKFRIFIEYIIRPLLLFVSILILVVIFPLGINGVISSYLISIYLGFFLAIYYAIKFLHSLSEQSYSPIREYRKLMSFSLPLMGVGFLTLVIERIDIFMLGYFKSTGVVGIYGAAARAAFLVLLPFNSFAIIFLPLVAAYHGQQRDKKIILLFKTVTKEITTFSLPLWLFFCLFSQEIMMFFGRGFSTGSLCLLILSSGWMFQNFTGPANRLIMMTGHSRINLINYIIIIVFNFVLNLFLIPKYGITGAALATACSMFLIGLVRTIEVYLIFKTHAYRRDSYKPFLAIIIVGIIIFFLKAGLVMLKTSIWLQLICCSFGLLTVYFSLLFLLKLSYDDLIIIGLIKKKISSLIPGHR